MRARCITVVFTALIFLGTTLLGQSYPCSVFKVTDKKGAIISGRTMEFGHDLKYALIVVPRDKAFSSPAPQNKKGLAWKSKLGYVGINIFGSEDIISDGMNEAGLAVSGLWYDPNMQWQSVVPGTEDRSIAHVMLGSWILGNFSTVDELREALKTVTVFGFAVAQMGMTPPIHLAAYDSKGGSIVVEYDAGKLRLYDNPLGIMTNAPDFPWMLMNLRNYIGMSNEQQPQKDYAGVKLSSSGHGSGMIGLPGDITPASRFVRLAVSTHFTDQQEDTDGLLNQARHIVNSLDIVKGMAVDRDAQGKAVASETTQWASYRDLTNRVFYFQTYNNLNLRMIDLKKLNFTADNVRVVPMYKDREIIIDVIEE